MSATVNGARVFLPQYLNRMLITKRSTLLPFLYHTATIRQYRTFSGKPLPGYPVEFGQDTSRSNYNNLLRPDDIPLLDGETSTFENSNSLSQMPNDRATYHRQRKSTITDSERKAFQRLFGNLVFQPERQSLPPDATDESSLDSILEDVLIKHRAGGNRASPSLKIPSIRSVAEVLIGRKSNQDQKTIRDITGDNDSLEALQEQQYNRVEGLLCAAKTDVELWNVLEREVFSIIRELDLDGAAANTEMKGKGAKRNSRRATPILKPTTENICEEIDHASGLAIIGPNYPSFLVIAVRQLRQEFPSSSLSLTILPTVKDLGRGSYVLGASTVLYNELISLAWLTYADFECIEELLQDMDNSGVDFDGNTLELLESIHDEARKACMGRFGATVAAVWEMDRFTDGWRKLERWRDIIKGRMQAEAIRKANAREIQPANHYTELRVLSTV
jgi:Mtf2 family